MSNIKRCIFLGVLMLTTASSHAVNATFQNFFFDACTNPTAALAARCGETNSGLGDLSGDSESSLNPSQTLGVHSGARANAELRQAQARTSNDGSGFSINLPVSEGPISLLLSAQHQSSELDRQVDADALRGYDSDGVSIQLGLDYRVNDALIVGALFHWDNSELEYIADNSGNNFNPTGRAGKVQQDGIGGSIFLSQALGERSYLDLAAGYLSNEYDITRRSLFQESNRVVATTAVVTDGNTDGQEVWASAAWGISFQRSAWSYGPYVSLNYSDLELDRYAENDLSNSGLAMNVAGVNTKSLRGVLGWHTGVSISGDGYVLMPQLRLEYLHEFEDDPTTASISYQQDANNTNFILTGDSVDASQIDISLGAALQWRNGWNSFLEVRSTFGRNDYEAFAVVAGLRVEL